MVWGAKPRYGETMSELPILYSFRRCPYAMRARMALAASGARVILREVLLKDKPAELMAISPRATVPVLVLSDGTVLDESLEVMKWALQQHDPLGWLESKGFEADWIDECDHDFKPWLDRYKYADRHPEHSVEFYRENAEAFICKLERALEASKWLCGAAAGAADVATFPFIRQFAGVDPIWWKEAPYPCTRAWLKKWLSSALFSTTMANYTRWESGQTEVEFPEQLPDDVAQLMQTP